MQSRPTCESLWIDHRQLVSARPVREGAMNAGKAFVAGIIGGAAMSAVMWMGRTIMGMDVNLSMMLGTMFVQRPGATAWIIGFIMHLIISGLIALIYAWGFEHVAHRAGWLVGVGFSLIHSIGTGLFMGLVPMMHPMMRSGAMPNCARSCLVYAEGVTTASARRACSGANSG